MVRREKSSFVDGTQHKCLWDYRSVMVASQGFISDISFILGSLCCNIALAQSSVEGGEVAFNSSFRTPTNRSERHSRQRVGRVPI